MESEHTSARSTDVGEMHDPGNESVHKRKKTEGGGGGGGGGDNGHSRAHEEARLKQLLEALTAAQHGEFDVRLPFTRGSGLMAEIARAFNQVVARNESLTTEIVRLERVVGREGPITERPSPRDAAGSWNPTTHSVNTLIANL